MDPITLIILAAIGLFAGAAATDVVRFAVLTLGEVRTWFQNRRPRLVHPDMVATTIVDLMASGSYRTVQGVFNQRTREWSEQRTIESDRISADLAELHRNRRVVMHTV
jgi:hypothetical protein